MKKNLLLLLLFLLGEKERIIDHRGEWRKGGERNSSGSIFMNRGRAAKTFALVKYNERVTTWSVREK